VLNEMSPDQPMGTRESVDLTEVALDLTPAWASPRGEAMILVMAQRGTRARRWRELLKGDAPVRAFVRDPDKGRARVG
jgi:hypothetical protein